MKIPFIIPLDHTCSACHEAAEEKFDAMTAQVLETRIGQVPDLWEKYEPVTFTDLRNGGYSMDDVILVSCKAHEPRPPRNPDFLP